MLEKNQKVFLTFLSLPFHIPRSFAFWNFPMFEKFSCESQTSTMILFSCMECTTKAMNSVYASSYIYHGKQLYIFNYSFFLTILPSMQPKLSTIPYCFTTLIDPSILPLNERINLSPTARNPRWRRSLMLISGLLWTLLITEWLIIFGLLNLTGNLNNDKKFRIFFSIYVSSSMHCIFRKFQESHISIL